MNPNDHWSKSFQDWRNGRISIGSIQKQLRLFKRIGIDLDLIKSDLASLHDYLDCHLLNPRYYPFPCCWSQQHGTHWKMEFKKFPYYFNIDTSYQSMSY